MSSLEEVLAEHRWLASQSCCQCGWGYGDMSDGLNHMAHQVEAVAAAGLAVIELPEPDRENPRVWRGSFGGMSCYATKAGTVGTPDGSITVAEARADAAALLAAADAAEAVQS